MKYLHTMVRVKNLEASLAFYCDIFGLVEIRRHDSEAGKYTNVFLAAPEDDTNAKENNTPLLELTYNWPDSEGKTEEYVGGRNFGHLAYEVDNIYETCQDLIDKGIIVNRPPRDGRMAFIKSPDGISIELLQKGDALPTEEPWSSMENTGSW
ncbi:MAG: lactoylglutathione lyase [Candidatus Azotimanducaceae bacterium]|jgi:lactoylglutathione lyase